VGFRALYLSGAGVANASYGWPDLGLTTLRDVLEDARRVAGATDLPLLVDADTGWDSPFMSARAARELCQAGAAGMHLEDQVMLKRCGHRPNKKLVPREEMCDRIRAAVDARPDPSFVVMARTDAVAVEGMDRAVARALEYVDAGADMVFPEALGELAQYERFAKAVGVPVLANITEFGKTPMFAAKELAGAGVRLVLYPLSAFRAMSAAAEKVYGVIRKDGTQKAALDLMQTREELYGHLDYQSYEQEMDRLIQEESHDDAG
ncbi:MAG TPA: methylisocitrate lyase, partial [Kiritimatiellia bacterium]|jgi:methylisocitrate lyase